MDNVIYKQQGAVACISLNRPDVLNAFNTELRVELLAAMEQANADRAIRAVLINAEGRGFSAGHDLKSGFGNHKCISETIAAEYKPMLMAAAEAPKLYVAAVQGVAAGIGGALALSCDFTVMAESAYLYQAFMPIALVPDGGATWHLVQTLGYKRALEAFVDGRKMGAQECISLGLANRVCPDDALQGEALAWAEEIAEGPPVAQRLTKELARKAMFQDLGAVIDAEALAQDVCSGTQDTQIAVKAFFTKTKPTFVGE